MWLSIYTMIGRVVVKPVKKLAGAANAWIHESDKMKETSHFSNLGIKSNDELKDLGNVMEDMEESIQNYIRDLRNEVSARERMNTELEVAAKIQFDMLPEPLQSDALDVSCFMRPAKLVGGDFYDYFQVDEDRIAMVVADVSDKGVPASLFMVISKTVIKMCILENPDDLLAAVSKANRLLVETNREMMFVTAFISIYSIKDGTLTYVNAGHENPVIYRKEDGRYSVIEEEHDLFIAADTDIEFTLRKIELKHGDRFIQYTDGVTEAMNVSDELLGLDGFVKALNSDTEKSGNDIINLVWDTVSTFQEGKEQSDDVTIVILET
jgi:sigma-B regulation protein RsbU (phosphoserine phosphatase)